MNKTMLYVVSLVVLISLIPIVSSRDYYPIDCSVRTGYCYMDGKDGISILTNNPRIRNYVMIQPKDSFEPVLEAGKTHLDDSSGQTILQDNDFVLEKKQVGDYDKWLYNFSNSAPNLESGEYSFHTRLRWIGTTTETVEYIFTGIIDTSPPTIGYVKLFENGVTDRSSTKIIEENQNVTIKVKVEDLDGGASDVVPDTEVTDVWVCVDMHPCETALHAYSPDGNGYYNFNITSPSLGLHTVYFYAQDNLTNLNDPVDYTFIVSDTAGPGIDVISPKTGVTHLFRPTISIKTSEPATCDLWLYGSSYIGQFSKEADNIHSLALPSTYQLMEGQTRPFNISCIDLSDNTNSLKFNILLDTEVPEIYSLSLTRPSPIYTWDDNNKITSLHVVTTKETICKQKGYTKEEGEQVQPGYGEMDYLSDLSYRIVNEEDITDEIVDLGINDDFRFYIMCESKNGLKTTLNFTDLHVHVGNLFPIDKSPSGIINNKDPLLYIKTSLISRCDYDDGSGFTQFAGRLDEHGKQLNLMEDGDYSYTLRCYTGESYLGTEEDYRFETTVSFVLDTKTPKPQITSIKDSLSNEVMGSSINDTNLMLYGTAESNAIITTYVEDNNGVTVYVNTTISEELSGNFIAAIVLPEADGSYSIYSKATDILGNENTSDIVNVILDRTGPIAPFIWQLPAETEDYVINVVGYTDESDVTVYVGASEYLLRPVPPHTNSEYVTYNSNLIGIIQAQDQPDNEKLVVFDTFCGSVNIGNFIGFDTSDLPYFKRYEVVNKESGWQDTCVITIFPSLTQNIVGRNLFVYDTIYPSGWFNISVELIPEMQNYIIAYAKDSGGNFGSESQAGPVYFHINPPALYDSLDVVGNSSFEVSGHAKSGSIISINNSGESDSVIIAESIVADEYGEFSTTISLYPGLNSIYARVIDQNDEPLSDASNELNVYYDNEGPDIIITQPRFAVNDQSVDIMIDLNDYSEIVSVELSINDTPPYTYSGTFNTKSVNIMEVTSPLSGNGTYLITVVGEDRFNNVHSIDKEFILDTSMPDPALFNLEDLVISDSSPVLNFTFSKEVLVHSLKGVAYVSNTTTDNKEFLFVTENLADGGYEVRITASSLEGGTAGIYIFKFTVDTIQPTFTVDSVEFIGSQYVTISGTCIDDNFGEGSIAILISGNPYATTDCEGGVYTIDMNVVGSRIIELRVTDIAGNFNTVMVDTGIPEIKDIYSIIADDGSILEGEPYNTNRGEVTISGGYVEEEFDTIEVLVNGEPADFEIYSYDISDSEGGFEINLTLDGEDGQEFVNNITIIVKDQSGFEGTKNVIIIKDLMGPSIVKFEPETYVTSEIQPTINITTSEYTQSCSINYSLHTTTGYQVDDFDTFDNYHFVKKLSTVIKHLPEGNYNNYVYITCIDRLGNEDTHQVEFIVDLANPVIYDFGIDYHELIPLGDDINSKDFLIKDLPAGARMRLVASTNEETKCRYHYGGNLYEFEGYGGYFNSLQSPEITLNDLTDYTYDIVCTDKAGRESEAKTINLQVNTQIVAERPVIYHAHPLNGTKSGYLTVTFNGSIISFTLGVSIIEAKVYTDNRIVILQLTDNTYSGDITFTQEGTYNFIIQAKNSEGLISNVSGWFEVDTTAPAEPDVIIGDPEGGDNPPVADAGEDRTVDVDQVVILNGLGSSDPDDDPLTYLWSQVSGPDDAILNNPLTANPTFIPDTAGTYVLSLVVNDGYLDSEEDTVVIDVMGEGEEPFCTDSDGGERYYIKGSVFYGVGEYHDKCVIPKTSDDGGYVEKDGVVYDYIQFDNDYCDGDECYIAESYCTSEGEQDFIVNTCYDGCENGACIGRGVPYGGDIYNITIIGKLIDQRTGESVNEARLSSAYEFYPEEVITDSDGSFEFKISTDFIITNGGVEHGMIDRWGQWSFYHNCYDYATISAAKDYEGHVLDLGLHVFDREPLRREIEGETIIDIGNLEIYPNADISIALDIEASFNVQYQYKTLEGYNGGGNSNYRSEHYSSSALPLDYDVFIQFEDANGNEYQSSTYHVPIEAGCGTIKLDYFDGVSEWSIECTDSDGGEDYYVEGTISYWLNDVQGMTGTHISSDQCEDSNTLWEYSCSNYDPNQIISPIHYTCTNGCEDGACIQ